MKFQVLEKKLRTTLRIMYGKGLKRFSSNCGWSSDGLVPCSIVGTTRIKKVGEVFAAYMHMSVHVSLIGCALSIGYNSKRFKWH